MAASGEEKVVKFQFSWPFHLEKFEGCQFNDRLYSAEFKTVHNKIGYRWRVYINPKGGKSAKGEEFRDHIGVYLQYLGNKEVRPVVLTKHQEYIDVEGARKSATDRMAEFVKHGEELEDDGQSVGIGVSSFLPVSVQGLRDQELISPGDILKVGVDIQIPEKMFQWKEILEARAPKKEWEMFFKEAFQSISVSKDPDTNLPSSFSGKYLDFQIHTSDGVDIACHSFILGGRNEYFRKMIESNMKEDKKDQKVDEVFDSGPMLELLHFIYTGAVSEKFHDQDLHIMLDGAHRYGLASLKLISEEKLMEGLSVGNSPEHLLLAGRYEDLHVLREIVLNLISENQGKVWRIEKGREMGKDLWQEVMDTSQIRMRVANILHNFC